jgi:hypothetical protein
MATFEFRGDTTAQGNQYFAARDMFVGADQGREGERVEALRLLTDLLGITQQAVASGSLAPEPGGEAAAQISDAISALTEPGTDAPRRARMSLARTRDILATAALVPALADAVAKAIEAVRGLC